MNTNHAQSPRIENSLPMTLTLVVAAAAFAAVVRLVPYEYRLLNFAPVGAVALFAGARLGLRYAIPIVLGSYALTDLALWYQQGLTSLYTPWYLSLFNPSLENSTYAFASGLIVAYCLVGYAISGQKFVGKSESPVAILLTTIGSGLGFFLITNFVSWLIQTLPYGYSLEGLFNCYVGAIPFYRGTFASDIVFTGLLFAAHAALSRAYFPAEKVIPVEVQS